MLHVAGDCTLAARLNKFDRLKNLRYVYLHVFSVINQSTDSTGGSISVGWENGPEWGLKTVSFNRLLSII